MEDLISSNNLNGNAEVEFLYLTFEQNLFFFLWFCGHNLKFHFSLQAD